jgi:hypothetical protein
MPSAPEFFDRQAACREKNSGTVGWDLDEEEDG